MSSIVYTNVKDTIQCQAQYIQYQGYYAVLSKVYTVSRYYIQCPRSMYIWINNDEVHRTYVMQLKFEKRVETLRKERSR